MIFNPNLPTLIWLCLVGFGMVTQVMFRSQARKDRLFWTHQIMLPVEKEFQSDAVKAASEHQKSASRNILIHAIGLFLGVSGLFIPPDGLLTLYGFSIQVGLITIFAIIVYDGWRRLRIRHEFYPVVPDREVV